ncbi:MAG: response regulator transcription factor [Firmicutes bacterium]|nr:response regulator transcription factor [Bacillota bacterium]
MKGVGDYAAITAREREILTLVAENHSYKEVAKELYISEKTVRNHMSNIFRKLGVRNRTEAVVYAIKSGLISLR